MSNTLNRSRREHREATRSDYDFHENRLFEIAKEASFAADPNRTAHSLAQIAMWLDGGSSSPVALSPIELADLVARIDEAERHAYRGLPGCFDRAVVGGIFLTWRGLIDRWATAPSDRATGLEADNLRDLSRIWRNALHSAVLAQDVADRLEQVRSREAVIAMLLHHPVPEMRSGWETRQ